MLHPRRHGAAARNLAAALLAWALLAAAPAVAPAAERVTIDDGHVDYAARLTEGRIESVIKDGTAGGPPVWRQPADVRFWLKPEARREIPSNPAFRFLGAAGDPTWLIPEVQRQGVVWLGWSTEALAPGSVDGDVSWELSAVEGPGEVAIYQSGEAGPVVLMSSADGLPDSIVVRRGVHAHANWAFSAEGEYRLTFTHSATVGGQPQSDTETISIEVGRRSDPGPGPGPDDPPGPGPGPEAGEPRLRIVSRAATVRAGVLPIRLRCRPPRAGRGAGCRATVRVRARAVLRRGTRPRAVTLARGRVRLAAGSARTVRLRVVPRLVRRVRTGRRRTVLAGHVTAAARPGSLGDRAKVRVVVPRRR